MENVACIDRRSVYAAGVSNGGGMAALLACQLSDKIAAVAAVAGAYADLPDCHPPRPVSLLEIHGTADTTVPDGGRSGEDTDTDSVLSFVQSWIERDGCPGEGAHAGHGAGRDPLRVGPVRGGHRGAAHQDPRGDPRLAGRHAPRPGAADDRQRDARGVGVLPGTAPGAVQRAVRSGAKPLARFERRVRQTTGA